MEYSFNDFMATQKQFDVESFDEWETTDNYYTTQCLALNAILTGDLHEGAPKGKAICLAGPSGSGKSYLSKCICRDAVDNKSGITYKTAINNIKNAMKADIDAECDAMDLKPKALKALKDEKYKDIDEMNIPRKDVIIEMAKYKDPTTMHIFWWDVEYAFENYKEIIETGIPPENFHIVKPNVNPKTGNPIPWSIEEWAHSVKSVLDSLDDFKAKWMTKTKKGNDEFPYEYIFVLDSIADLSSNKEMLDVERQDSVSDFGSRAKIIRGRLKAIASYMRNAKITFILINQTYDDPGNPYAILPKMSGGSYVMYFTQRVIWVRSKDIKNEDADKNIKKFKGINIVAFNYKNRHVQKGTYVDLELKPMSGMNKYYDILRLVPDLFPPTNKEGSAVSYEWFKSVTFGEAADIMVERSEGAITKDMITLVSTAADNTMTIALPLSLSAYNKFTKVKHFFEFVDKTDTGIIVKTVAKVYKKDALYAMGDDFFTPYVLEKINKSINGWMKLGSATEEDDDTLPTEDEEEFDCDEVELFDFNSIAGGMLADGPIDE